MYIASHTKNSFTTRRPCGVSARSAAQNDLHTSGHFFFLFLFFCLGLRAYFNLLACATPIFFLSFFYFLFPADSSYSAPPCPSLWGLKRVGRCQRHRSLVDASDSRLRVSPHCSHRGDHSIVSTHHHYHLIVLAGCCVHDGVLW